MRALTAVERTQIAGGNTVSEVVVVGNGSSYSLGGIDVFGMGMSSMSWWSETYVPGQAIEIHLADLANLPTPPPPSSNDPVDPSVTPSGSTTDLDEILCVAIDWKTDWIDAGGTPISIQYPELVDGNELILDEINWVLPGPHNYAVVNKVSNVTTMAEMIKAFNGLTHYAAPGQNGQAYDGKIVNTPFGPVKQSVDYDTLTVTNRAQEGHVLYPGDVQRTVVQGSDGIYILTVGTGEGWLGDLNVLMSPMLWGAQDAMITTWMNNN